VSSSMSDPTDLTPEGRARLLFPLPEERKPPVMNLTASIGNEPTYVYQCSDHPECGPDYHIIAASALDALPKAEQLFVMSHIPERWAAEWDWDHPVQY
jgi:hypothetical protein